MSDRRIVMALDDGSIVTLTWEKGTKFTVEVDETVTADAPDTETSRPIEQYGRKESVLPLEGA